MSNPVDVHNAFNQLRFVAGRTPASTVDYLEGAFAELAPYRDGAVFIAHYAGNSEWERHAGGDELVFVLEGETTLFLLDDDDHETANALGAGLFLVVPAGTWHRFETPAGVKVMTVTPQPTDHSVERPQ